MPNANPFDRLEAPVRDLHHQAGWDGLVYTQHRTAESDGGRATWSDPHVEEATIRIEWGANQPRTAAGSGAGQQTDEDVLLHLDAAEVGVADSTTFAGGYGTDYGAVFGGATVRASIIEDARNGRRYRVVRLRDENYGILTCDVESTDWTHPTVDDTGAL